MSPNYFTNLSSNRIYKGFHTIDPNLNQSTQFDTNYRSSLSPIKSNYKSRKNSSSLILQQYQQTLKKQLQQSEIKDQIRKDRRRYQAIEAAYQEHRESRKMLSQLQSIKYRLKTLSLQRQSDLIRQQKLILLNKSTDFQQRNQSQMYHSSLLPLFNPMLMQNPYGYYPTHQNNNQYSHPPINKSNSKIKSNKKKLFLKETLRQSYYETPTPHKQQNKVLEKIKQKKIIQKKQLNRSQFKKRINDFQRYNHKQQNIKRLKKCFLAVYFTVCIKKMYLKIVKQRKKFFLQFWPGQFLKFQDSFKDYIYKNLLPFFKLLKQKQYSSILPQQDDSKTLKIQKNRTIRQLIKLFFQCIQPLKIIQNLGKIAWSFCNHISFVNHEVLSVNQVDFVCFNQPHGYLRMDNNLEKSQIISFIFIKLIIFKLLLHPQKKWPKQYNRQKNQFLIFNLKVIGSILYDIFIQLQQTYLNQVNVEKYPIGNYKQIKAKNKQFHIQFSPPLLYETKKVEDEIISGLFSQQYIKQHISLKKITSFIQIAKQIIQGIHKTSKQYNNQFKSKILKFVLKPQYQY